MRMNPWLRVFACGATVGVGSLLGVPLWGASDDPPAANDNASSVKDDSKPGVKTKRKGKPKKSDETPQADVSESASPEPQSPSPKSETPLTEFALTKELLGNLSPEHMKSLGQMLDQDWKDRPEWGEMAVAILKDDFMRPGAGWWKPSAKRYDWKWLSERLDANKDGKVDRDELPGDVAKADQLFERLDRDGDGKVMPADFDYSDPNPLTMMMNVPAMKNMMSNQLFSRLDKDSNGRVTMQELAEFFRYGDKEELEFLTPEDLRFAMDPPPSKKPASEPDNNPASAGPSTPAAALKMFLRGDMGWLTAGPQLGDVAPDFTLPKHDGTAKVKLSDSFGMRPVVLVFGSFTWGPYRSQSGVIDKLFARFKDRADFYSVYIREAHPSDGWSMESNNRAGISVTQPKTTAERTLVAVHCCDSFKMALPMLVDDIDDAVGKAYSGFPDRLYLIDREGRVAYKGGRGPFGYKPRELEQTLIMLLLDEALPAKSTTNNESAKQPSDK